MCAGALIHARIAALVFGAREPRAGAIVSTATVLDNASLNHRVAVVEGVLSEPSGALLREFFRMRRQARVHASRIIGPPCSQDGQ